MTPNEHDTDPSTPSARRSTEEPYEPRERETRPEPFVRSSPPMKASTDPGVAPPAELRGPSERPMGIVVPAAARESKKDSVELLLDGMLQTPQPERTKTKPQTDGEASASYHVRHDVRAARTSPDEEPKVIVDRTTEPAIRVERTTEPEPVRAPPRPVPGPTANLPPRLGPRVVMAAVAGGLVVLIVFIALRSSGRHGTAGDAALPALPGASAPSPAALDVVPTAAPETTRVSSAQPAVQAPATGASPLPAAASRAVDSVAVSTDTASAAPPSPRRAAPSGSSSRSRPKSAAEISEALDAELKTTFQ
jgi:hypothetical protein